MGYSPDAIDTLKRNDRFGEQIAGERGIIADLMRDNVIVHVSKPIGSISGWVGAYFWQVWVEPFHAPGQVSARFDRGARIEWQLDDAPVPELLSAAKDKLLALIDTDRKARLAAAQDRLATLEGAR